MSKFEVPPSRVSHSKLTIYFLPSSSCRMDASKPEEVKYTGSLHGPSIFFDLICGTEKNVICLVTTHGSSIVFIDLLLITTYFCCFCI